VTREEFLEVYPEFVPIDGEEPTIVPAKLKEADNAVSDQWGDQRDEIGGLALRPQREAVVGARKVDVWGLARGQATRVCMRAKSPGVIRTETASATWAQLIDLPSEISVQAGIFEELGGQQKKPSTGQKKPSGLTLAEVANIHEFGALIRDAAGEVIGEIPQRSFIRGWFDANEDRIQAEFVRRLAANGTNIRRALEQLALWIEAELKRNVHNGGKPPFKPLSKQTIRRKRSSKPLIDTSQLVNAIMAKVTAE
jgi:hypothetical protein